MMLASKSVMDTYTLKVRSHIECMEHPRVRMTTGQQAPRDLRLSFTVQFQEARHRAPSQGSSV